jgi:hypothetical protein
MNPKLLMSEEEIRSIYRQGEEEVIALVMALLKINEDHEERFKRLEDHALWYNMPFGYQHPVPGLPSSV